MSLIPLSILYYSITMCLSISGGHLNPAVTLAMACLGKLKWRKVPVYFLAQYLGCFIASAVLFAIYADAFNAHDRGSFRYVTKIILLHDVRITTKWFSISKIVKEKHDESYFPQEK